MKTLFNPSIKHRYKVLPQNICFNKLLAPEKYILNSSIVEIPARFNRDGRYFDRYENRVWFESGGRAFQEANCDIFIWDLESLNRYKPTIDELQAIKILSLSKHPEAKKFKKNYEECYYSMINEKRALKEQARFKKRFKDFKIKHGIK